MMVESMNYFSNSNGFVYYDHPNYGYRIVDDIYGSPYDPREFKIYKQDEEEEIGQLAAILVDLAGPGVLPPLPKQNLDVVQQPPQMDPIPILTESLSKKKRQRTTREQLDVLEQYFQMDKMPSQQARSDLAKKLGMSSRRVQIWFQNKRAKLKRVAGQSGKSPDASSDSDIGERENSSPIMNFTPPPITFQLMPKIDNTTTIHLALQSRVTLPPLLLP